MGYFNIFAWVIFLPAIILIAILMLPMPNFIRRATLAICDRTLFFSFSIGNFPFPLLYFVLMIATATFLDSAYVAQKKGLEYEEVKHKTGRGDDILPKKWRAERNAWIAGFSLTCWVVLLRYRNLLKEKCELEEKLKRR